MRIAQLTIHNFRIYSGENTLSFLPYTDKNISIIAGKNGYGKTTLLTALIWAFYGKFMAQVEDKYRKDIKSYGGYDRFLVSLLNRDVRKAFEEGKQQKAQFSVTVELTDVLIPSIPCKKVTLKRTFDLAANKETLNILIDGIENELTKDVGYDAFINDFILPREIARFFFFDAEKIVALAEARTKEELRSLSNAYAEVLGIKKYHELKKNLEALLTKLRRNGAAGADKDKLRLLEQKEQELCGLIDLNAEKQAEIEREVHVKKKISDELQEKLIREGNAITVEELKALKKERDVLKQQSADIKSRLNTLMELAPLVIAGKKLVQLRAQLHKEQSADTGKIRTALERFSNDVLEKLGKAAIPEPQKREIENAMKSTLSEKYSNTHPGNVADILLGFTKEQYLNFEAVYANIKGAYVNQLNAVIQEEKSNRVLLLRTLQKIKQAEARKDNPVVKKYRQEKERIQNRIAELTTGNHALLEETGALKVQLQSTRKALSECEKHFKLAETDRKKYEVADTLHSRIVSLISRIKEEKKYALQKSLKLGLNTLMHKKDFIGDVRINIEEDRMDIDLFDARGNRMDKDALSKGEQQLYATALLKALTDESGIAFPVFIDSPLQKFDRHHAGKIIREFYPKAAPQVVLLPLPEKELTADEYKMLTPYLGKTFLIELKPDGSVITPCRPEALFNNLKEDVYADKNQ